jgi:zinc protease
MQPEGHGASEDPTREAHSGFTHRSKERAGRSGPGTLEGTPGISSTASEVPALKSTPRERQMHRNRLASALVTLLILAIAKPLGAQEPTFSSPQDSLPRDPNVVEGRLDNGLTFIIRANAQPENRAELRLVVNAGSVLEDSDQQGLAHMVEHMAFNGTANFQKQELVSYLESIGMAFGPEINAYTSFDETVYMLQIPTDDPDILAKAFQILEDWAHQVSFEPEEIDKERGVVVEEWRLGRGAAARMQDQQFPVLFKGSRYAERLPIGKPEIIESFPPDVLTRFYADWYRPDLMAVIAVGDFDVEAVEATIRQHFSRLPVPENPRARVIYDVPGHDETLFAIASDAEATTSQVALLYKQPPSEEGTLEAYRRSLVEGLYNAVLNDRLFELSQQAAPPFAFAGSGQGRLVRSGEVYQLVAMVQEGGIVRGLEALLTEAERMSRHGVTSAELERQKANFLRAMEQAYAERENQESQAYASEYVRHFLEGEPIPGIEFEWRAVQALLPTITLEEVNRVAQRWMVDKNRVVLANSPEKEGLEIPTEEELAGVFNEVMAMEVAPYEDTASDEPLLATLPAPSPVIEEATVPELGLTTWTLENGVRVLLKPTDFKDDEVLFQAYSPGGFSLSDEEEHMSASSAAQVVALGGVGAFSQVDLGKKLAGKAASVSPSIGELTEGLSGSASPKDLETLFQLIYLYFTQPRRDSVAFQAMQQQMGAFLANRNASPMAAFQDTITVTMAQGHPRARPISMELFQEIDLEEAYAFYRERFADASDFTFVFAGAFQPEEIRPLVETYLGGLPSIHRTESWRDLDMDPPTGVIRKEVRRGVEPQSQTQIIFTGPFDYTAENRLGMRAMTGALEIRLRELIREELGGTYGVGVSGSYEKYPEAGYAVRISFGADPERVEGLVEALFNEMDAFKRDGPTPEELQSVKEQERRNRETNLRENRWWVAQLLFSDEYGTDPRFLLDDSLLAQVTAESIQRDAQRYLRTDNYVQVTLFPESRR